ncbi:ATP-grasp fold amidoligase family protein [uncultured Cellulomonas sp.]|uniref:ATP-grasp fold amidoligase family protein n=1 Tax=uncultured Cellulomonas sp. TaxID=189682 RepID=UPI00261BA1ED|nr:ATP-grasp fold amidoligase family protein [uncultured Cellulomonas sp.]
MALPRPLTQRQVRGLMMHLPLPVARYLLLLQEYKRLPHLANPVTFNEKINYRIVHDRRPMLAMASSKVASKEYVAGLGTGVHVPTTYWNGVDLREIDGMTVPTSWVLKASHRSRRLVHGEAGTIDVGALDVDVDEWLVDREYLDDRLWGYREARKELLLEERVGSPEEFPDDLKFFVFDGRVEMIQVDHGRRGAHTRNLYSADWTPLRWNYTRPTGPVQPAPANLDRLLDAAGRIGAGWDFVRVDLYNLTDQIVFGEMTAYPGAGVSPWPYELDRFIGGKWTLPGRSVLAGPAA